MAVVVVWVGGRGGEAVDADGGAGVAVGAVVLVIGTSRVVATDVERPVCFECGDVVRGVEVEIAAVGDELGKGIWQRWVWRPIELVCDYWKVWVDVTELSRDVFG